MLSMSALTNSVKNVVSFFLQEKFIFIVFFLSKDGGLLYGNYCGRSFLCTQLCF